MNNRKSFIVVQKSYWQVIKMIIFTINYLFLLLTIMKQQQIVLTYHKLLAIFLLLTPIGELLALDNQLCFKRLSVDDGLSQNTVFALTQDHNNRMWVGTADGLNCYDGYRFVTFYNDLSDSTSLANNRINSLCTDRNGTVWAGTLVGLSRYNVVGNNFTNYYLSGNQPMKVYAIEDLGITEELLLATNLGLVVFDKKTGRMNIVSYLTNVNIYAICLVDDGVLLGTASGVYFYYIRNGEVKQLLPQLQKEVISDIIYDPKTKYCWIGSLGNGLYCIDDKFRVIKHYTQQYGVGRLTSNSVRILQQDENGKIWIGTVNALFVFNPMTETFDKCSFSYEDQTSLGHNSVRSFYKDNQGGIWVGTYYGGINYYHPMAPSFSVLRHSLHHNSLNDNTVSCIVEDPRKESLWIGTNDGGLNCYNRKEHRFSYYSQNGSSNSLKSNNIKCVFPDEDGNVYVGTHGGGLSYIHVKTGQVENYTIPQAVSTKNSCYALLDGQDGTFWVGTMVGLYQFDRKNKTFSLHPLANKYTKLNEVLIYTFCRDSQGRVWIGTEESLFVCTGDGKVRELTDKSPVRSATLIQTFGILEDSHKNIWIASTTGLYKYNEKEDSFNYYSTHDGLPNNYIYGILEDTENRLWLTTNKGLSCFDPEQNTFRNYTTQDGLSHNQFNHYGLCKTHDGIFFLGTLGGITYFNPAGFVDNPFAPNAVISGASVLNHPLSHAQKEGMAHFYQDEKGVMLGMSFPSNMKLFNIAFTVVNYLAGKRNMFAYKLEGFDKDWFYTQEINSREVSYSNLPPGKYIFRVKACNNDGKWSERPVEFFVCITPMWYQTWWFKLLVVLLISGVIGFVIYFLIARAKLKMQMQIEHIERDKIEEISQEKVRFYINMSHELRTPLTLILGPLEELLEQSNTFDKRAQKKLSYIYKNGQRLLHIINQLLDFRRAELGALPIHVVPTDVDEVAVGVFSMFKETALKRNINYSFQSELGGIQLPADKMYLEMIMMNLLSNAFKFTPDGKDIELSLWKQEDCFGFSVKDGGIGISPDKQKRIFERFYQVDETRRGTGIGLSLVKCLVTKHHGDISIKSELGQYTEFSVSLPIVLSDYSDVEQEGEDHTHRADEVALPLLVESEIEVAHGEAEGPVEDDMGEKDIILLVDDNKEMIDYLRDHFHSKYITLTAKDGGEALDILKEQKVDVVLSDVMMPGVDGIKLCELIKKNLSTCHIPVILLSAKGNLDAQFTGIRAGADDYIAKPFSMSLLQGKIANILRGRQRLRHFYSDTIDIDTAKMTSNPLDEEFMTKAIKVVEKNIDNGDFSIGELAEELCISRSTLFLKMNSISGEPPANFIRRIRLNRACKMMLEGRYSISEISGMTGFSSPSYFTTSFKKYVGCLPTEYVKNQGRVATDKQTEI